MRYPNPYLGTSLHHQSTTALVLCPARRSGFIALALDKPFDSRPRRLERRSSTQRWHLWLLHPSCQTRCRDFAAAIQRNAEISCALLTDAVTLRSWAVAVQLRAARRQLT